MAVSAGVKLFEDLTYSSHSSSEQERVRVETMKIVTNENQKGQKRAREPKSIAGDDKKAKLTQKNQDKLSKQLKGMNDCTLPGEIAKLATQYPDVGRAYLNHHAMKLAERQSAIASAELQLSQGLCVGSEGCLKCGPVRLGKYARLGVIVLLIKPIRAQIAARHLV